MNEYLWVLAIPVGIWMWEVKAILGHISTALFEMNKRQRELSDR